MCGKNWKFIIISTKCHNASRSQIGKLNEVAVNRISATDDCRLVLKAGCDHLSEIDFDGLYEASFSERVCILAHAIRKKSPASFPPQKFKMAAVVVLSSTATSCSSRRAATDSLVFPSLGGHPGKATRLHFSLCAGADRQGEKIITFIKL